MNWVEHVKNRNAVPLQELLKYEGQHVAWSIDGAHVLAGDEDPLKLIAKLQAAGHKSDDYVLSFVDFESEFGGAAFNEGVWEDAD